VSHEIAFAQYLTFRTESGNVQYHFQNYWVNEDAPYEGSTYGFMPFAFSGLTVTKTGDNQPATLVFPNNSLSRGWAETAVVERWIAKVSTVVVNPDDKTDYTAISTYESQIVSGNWDTTKLELQTASVLDAVGSDVPRKRLTKRLVGNLPVTASVRVQ